jgi:signal transduction histidine kinase
MRGSDRLVVRTHQCDVTSARPVRGGELKPGAYLVLAVSDSGRPIDPQSLEHLFEPLYPIHDDIGVELAPIYGIVQGLGGGIDVQTGDRGTTFELFFPAVSAAQPHPAPAGSTLVEKS